MNSIARRVFIRLGPEFVYGFFASILQERVSGLPRVLTWVRCPLHLVQPAVPFAEDDHDPVHFKAFVGAPDVELT